ncbi:MAG: SHOCT domain-containing protein [Actinomycetes bacterium]
MLEASSSYPLLDAMWTMFVFFAWVIWIWLLFTIFGDLFRRHDVSGWGKAGWTVLMLCLPFIGVLIYLIGQSQGIAERRAAEVDAAQQRSAAYIRSVSANGNGAASEIGKAKELLDSGSIDEDEFETLKHKALAS